MSHSITDVCAACVDSAVSPPVTNLVIYPTVDETLRLPAELNAREPLKVPRLSGGPMIAGREQVQIIVSHESNFSCGRETLSSCRQDIIPEMPLRISDTYRSEQVVALLSEIKRALSLPDQRRRSVKITTWYWSATGQKSSMITPIPFKIFHEGKSLRLSEFLQNTYRPALETMMNGDPHRPQPERGGREGSRFQL